MRTQKALHFLILIALLCSQLALLPVVVAKAQAGSDSPKEQTTLYAPQLYGNADVISSPADQGKPPSNNWVTLQPGPNGLIPRYAPPKLDKVVLDQPKITIAGLFVVKFVEGSHVRPHPEGLVVDTKDMNNEEIARLNRVGLKPANVESGLTEFNATLKKYNAGYGFQVASLFRSAKDFNDNDQQFKE